MYLLLTFCLLGVILETSSFPTIQPSADGEASGEVSYGNTTDGSRDLGSVRADLYGWSELLQCDRTACGNASNGLPCGGPERGLCGCGSCTCNIGWRGPTCDCLETDIFCWLTPPSDPIRLGPNDQTNSTNKFAPAPYHLLTQLEEELGLRPEGRVTGRGQALTTWNCNTVTGVPTSVRSSMRLSYFYQKYLHAYGIPVLSSNRVPDSALRRACYVVRFLFADRRDVRDHFYDRYGRHALMAETEKTTDIPEHSWLGPSWNDRARGLGATETHPVSTGAEENVNCYAQGRDKWFDEDIFLHETAHGLHGLGAKYAIPGWQTRLEAAYNSALARGLWANTYAATTVLEYFAEGVQSFFNVESYQNPPNGIHNDIDTREKLLGYDPTLHRLIEEVFPCRNNVVDRCEDQGLIGSAPLKMDCNSDGSGGTDVGSNSGGSESSSDNGDDEEGFNCEDNNASCAGWAGRGECQRNPGYMNQNCRKSCDLCGGTTGSNCTDKNDHCGYWAQSGYCSFSSTYMNDNCRKSCGRC